MSDKSIDEKLREVIWYELGDGLNATDVDEAVNAIKETFRPLLMDVIGEDEFPPDQDEWYGEDEAKIIGRDELRAEQRQKLKELFNKEKI